MMLWAKTQALCQIRFLLWHAASKFLWFFFHLAPYWWFAEALKGNNDFTGHWGFTHPDSIFLLTTTNVLPKIFVCICWSRFFRIRTCQCSCLPCYMLQLLFPDKWKGGLCRGIFPLLLYFPLPCFLVAWHVLFMSLKIKLLYLKMQTQDHFRSAAHPEVVSPAVSCHRKKHKLNCNLSSIQTHWDSWFVCLLLFLFCYVFFFYFLAGLQSNWAVEGAVGSAEGHGGHASISAWRYEC